MAKLLRSIFIRIFSDISFVVCSVISLGLGILLAAVQDDKTLVLTSVSTHTMVIPLVSAIFTSLFLVREFTNGTIRNKLIAGHSRSNVYLSFFICMSAANLVFYALFEGAVLGMGAAIGDYSLVKTKALVIILLLGVVMTISSCAVSVAICMLMQNNKCIVFSIAVPYILTALSLDTDKDSFASILASCFPQGYSSLVPFEMPDKPLIILAKLTVTMIVITALSIYHFTNRDMK